MSHGKGINKGVLNSAILHATGESPARCYQCGKCSAGCPVAAQMDYPPSRLMRMLQAGMEDLDAKVVSSGAIWLCVGCETCVSRCPQEVDIPKIMDALRAVSLGRKKPNPSSKNIIRFHTSFLDTVRYTGRLFEVGLIADYKLRSRRLLQDLLIAPRLFFKGKLGIFPHPVRDRRNISRIFSGTINRNHKESRV